MDLRGPGMRLLAEDEDVPPEKWELIFMSVVMILMFAALITDRIAPDHTFVIAVAFCMVTGIVTIKEGLQGFANEGVLTVMVRKGVPQNALPPVSCFCVSLIAMRIPFFSSSFAIRSCLLWRTD